MDAQHERGHDVGWFFCGRSYPLMHTPRLKRWSRRGIAMHEVVNTSIQFTGEPEPPPSQLDLDHGPRSASWRWRSKSSARTLCTSRSCSGYRPLCSRFLVPPASRWS